MKKTLGYAARTATAPLEPFIFERRDVGAHDVAIEILFCGVCHSDIHFAHNEWHDTVFPVVPGHEIVGRVTAVGEQVASWQVGDLAMVGPVIDSCRTCYFCTHAMEQYCTQGFTMTFNAKDRHTGGVTYGGYSQYMVVDAAYVVHIPAALQTMNLAQLAPLACAGTTTYVPLMQAKITAGMRVGIAGIGGLGHLAIKFARALGAQVTMLTTTPEKIDDAHRLGADDAILVTDQAQMNRRARSLDYILSTIPVAFNLDPYLNLLRFDGTLCMVGIPAQPYPFLNPAAFIERRVHLTGSLVGGIAQTTQMLEFCAQHAIVADVQIIAMDEINAAFDKVVNKQARYRYVVDLQTLR